MSLASTGFCAPVRQTGTPKPVGALSARPCGSSRRAKTRATVPMHRDANMHLPSNVGAHAKMTVDTMRRTSKDKYKMNIN